MNMSLMEDGGLSEYLNEGNYNDEDALPDGSEENPFGPDDEHIDGDSGTAGVKVEPKKRCIRNPKPRLTIQLLRGPKGIHTIEDHFKGLKLRGKGYEREDLDEIMERLQSWGSFLYPLDTFDNLLNTIERLNKKRELQTHMARYRAGLLESMKMKDDKVGAENGEGGEVGDEAKMVARPDDEPFDEIDALLDQQIAMSMMTNDTPQKPSSSRRFDELMASSSFSGPFNQSTSKRKEASPAASTGNRLTSQDSAAVTDRKPLSSEQMARIAENRRLALERLAAKRLASQT